MSIKLTVTPTTVPLIRKAYQDQLAGITAELEKKNEEITLLKAAHAELEKSLKELEDALTPQINGYNVGWSVIEKIKYILRNSDKALTSREISEKLMSIDAGMAEKRDTTIKNVSTILSVYRSDGNDNKPFTRIDREKQDNLFTINK